jgi:arabinan endo-1,5-alpha-L-arabinosidase
MRIAPIVGLLGLALASCALAPSGSPPAPAAYANPVLDADFPDPAVLLAPDGFHYAYATQTSRDGRMVNIQVARSRDLVGWQHLGDALPAKPRWASQTQDFWAPHVVRDGDRYIMYYSAKPDVALADTSKGLCLAIATATSPTGPFVDQGQPLRCGDSFVEIDPFAYDDPETGKRLLYWGSGFKSIKVQELAPDRVSFAAGSSAHDLVSPNPTKDAFPVLVEGAWVLRRGGYYYLFYSGDNCCGPKANYAVMVARSRNATGPFQTLEQATAAPHSIILAKNDRWFAPGHNSVVTDRHGNDWMVYHAVDAGNPRAKATDEINTRRIMLIDRIVWRNGWPVVNGPSRDRQAAPDLR